jgi:hypothetical protein
LVFEAFLAQLLGGTPISFGAAPPSPPPSATNAPSCPDGMKLVEGSHSEFVQRLCVDWRMGHCFAFFPGLLAEEPRTTPVRVCMDVFEWPNRAGALPEVMMRFVEAEAKCAGVGKRLCSEFEWELACEGPRRLPFPYGWRADERACNSAKPYRAISEGKISSDDARVREAETKRLWQGEPTGSFAGCVSPFGIVDLVGNVEEWVTTSRPEWPWRSGLKGGYWSKPWAGCRGTNERHGPLFRFYEIGFRCCRDPS